MSDKMTPIPFDKLMTWIIEEHKKGSIFGIKRPYAADPTKACTLFGHPLETPFGPAAGPHTQLAQNIIAAYAAGSRFFELKTVQKLDGEDLPVAKPCILADDECYNCEWSTELYVPQAFDEYVKAWFALKVLAIEYGLGSPDGFQFNMSVGYDLEGIKTKKIDDFIEGLKDASDTPIFKACKEWLLANTDQFEKLCAADIEAISPNVCQSATLSTLHGCPPQEIERIAGYLLTEKKVHTFIKCNPTLLGYDYARKLMDDMGYDYVVFGDFHFKDDLQYADAIPMLKRLQALADEKNLAFGVKITNTFPVDVTRNELPSEEMYMSGKSLFALSMSVAEMLSRDFDGKLRISYSGGADYFNIKRIVDAGIWPVTMATTLLKPGGYQRLEQMAQLFSENPPAAFTGVDTAKVSAMIADARTDKHHVKAIKPLPDRKIKRPVPLTDCFVAPCKEGCPIHQDVTRYMSLEAQGCHKESLEVILEKNPLPFITGTICAHNCMSKCNRNYYETPVHIRDVKLQAAENGISEVMKELTKVPVTCDARAAVIGAGPAGLAAAWFLTRGGMKTTVYEKEKNAGGVVRRIIPSFRISDEAIDRDVRLCEAVGVEFRFHTDVASLDELKKEYDYIVLAVGSHVPSLLTLTGKEPVHALDFLAEFNASNGTLTPGKNVVVIGGGNTAMDTARAALRARGVEKVSLVYRRTRRYMPADEEELEMALADGVEFAELLAPFKHENGTLFCKKMKLGAPDESGRPSSIETDDIVELPADAVIAAVGEKIPSDFYQALGVALDGKRRPVVNATTLESSLSGVYIVGDGLFGPATVVEAIRDGRMAAEGILGKSLVKDHFKQADADAVYARKGNLKETEEGVLDCTRCLACDSFCENCTEVCPNRANLSLAVPGLSMHQIIHMDPLCNECGNCRSFCPWDSAPYLDKFTYFSTLSDMENSANQGFVITDLKEGQCTVRLNRNQYTYTKGTHSSDIPAELCAVMDAFMKEGFYHV